MRTANYRDDVLWAIAYKLGLNPVDNLLQDQADALANYINAWVRKSWSAADWPEWTLIRAFNPDFDNIVYPDSGEIEGPESIGRVLKVYAANPLTTPGPIDIPFKLMDTGIYVGLERGPAVWIKYITLPPRFTAIKWDPTITYGLLDVVYSTRTGNCYQSRNYGNVGNDPDEVAGGEQAVGTKGITQKYAPPNPSVPTQPQIVVAAFTGLAPGPDPTSTPPVNAVFAVKVKDSAGAIISNRSHTADGVETLATILTNLRTDLNTDLTGLGFTTTVNTSLKTITFQYGSDFTVTGNYTAGVPAINTTSQLVITQTQPYLPALATGDPTRQLTKISLDSNEVPSGATYKLIITDNTGVDHFVSYTAHATDGPSQVLVGLETMIVAGRATDAFLNDVSSMVDTALLTLTLSVGQAAAIDIHKTLPYIPPPPGPPTPVWWAKVLFPLALVEPVVRGAYSDALREGGQLDKAGAEEQGASGEEGASETKFIGTAYNPLTDQQKPAPRYRVSAKQ